MDDETVWASHSPMSSWRWVPWWGFLVFVPVGAVGFLVVDVLVIRVALAICLLSLCFCGGALYAIDYLTREDL